MYQIIGTIIKIVESSDTIVWDFMVMGINGGLA